MSGLKSPRLLLVAGALLAYLLLLETLGFVIITFLFLFLLFHMAYKGWAFSAVTALAGAAFSYVVFRTLAKNSATRGPLGLLSMEIFQGLLHGFQVALQPINLLYCFMGVFIGTLVGVLPGLGPAAAIALLLPSTFAASPVSAIILLAGIYYGAMYGGSTTSILVNIPGEAASVVTCLDGHAMARQGRAGPALGISAFGSFIAGTLSVIVLTFLAPYLAKVALSFGPPEYFGLIVLGLTILTYFARGSMVKALIMAAVGLLCGTVGVGF